MHPTGEHALGFLGPAAGFPTATSAAGPTLRVPQWRQGQAPSAEGPFGAIEVHAFTESMGRFEAAVEQLAGQLLPGGIMALDIDNAQSVRQLRMAIEGRAGTFDPAGSMIDPTRPLTLRRALHGLDAAGLHIEDVAFVGGARGELHADFSSSMFAQGFLPLQWLDGPPPNRFWITCKKAPSLAGSALVGHGPRHLQERTVAAVRAFLPPEWEVRIAEGANEAASWSRAIGEAQGDLVWFLRAGAQVSAELFTELALQATLGPAAPGNSGMRSMPGDLCGLMASRLDLLLAGPIRARQNSQIALEEHCMRLEAVASECALVEGEFASPPAPAEEPAAFAAEAQEMLECWQQVQQANVREARVALQPVAPAPWRGRKPRVSLCMIARDEERFLAECLRRAQPAVDEILVVDTGSKDRTIEIARSFGAKVVERPWDEDFSAPRNVSLQHATGDWILVLDADEFLTDGAAERIRELVENEAVCGYHMRFVNHYSGGKTLGVMMVRLFRNLPGIAYQNVIHEQVTPSLVARGRERSLSLSTSDIEVEHHGYSDEVVDSRKKNERNERLFQKQLSQTPDDIYCLYKYGDFLRRLPGRERDAYATLESCLEQIRRGPPSLPRELPYAGEVAALCALERAKQGRTQEAMAIVDEALRRFLPTPNLHYLAASLLLATSQPDAAIEHFKRCLAYRGQVLVVPIEEGITGHVSLVGIAQAMAQKGDLVRALRLLQRAVELAPDYEVGQMALSKLQLCAGDPAAALQTMTRHLQRRPESVGACQQAALILQRLGCAEQAQKLGRRAVELLRRRGAAEEADRMERILAAT